MKLLYLCSDFGIRFDGVKGASIHVRAITRALSDCGHQVMFLGPHGGPGADHPAESLLGEEACGEVKLARGLRRWLKDRDLPHTAADEMRNLIYGRWAGERACDRLRADPPDAVIERLSPFGHIGLDLADRLGCPHIVEVNALLAREAERFRDLALGGLAREIERRVLERADGITVVSRELRRQLGVLGIDEKKIAVVLNGADVDAFDPADSGAKVRRSLGLGGSFVVGFVGSLKTWHGVDLLIEAFRRVLSADGDARRGNGAKLLIVGTGPTEEALRRQAAAAGLSGSVVFAGGVEHGEVPSFVSAMDVAVAPFRDIEGFYFSPIKVFEYMAAGRCVVASRLGQIEEVVADRHRGLLCKPDDAEALSEVLLIARNDPPLRRRLGSAARAHVERHHSWRNSAQKTMGVVTRHVSNRERVTAL